MNRALFAVFAARLFLFVPVAAANTVFESELVDVKDDVASLQLRLDALEQKANTPQVRPNLFNPGITAFGNFLTCVGQGYKNAHGLCESTFSFREAELDLRASVDPWADAVFILAFEPGHAEEGHEGHDHGPAFSVEIEEAFVVLKKLPILNDAPLGLKLKAGRFRSPFGRFNQIHLHDLPQMTMPRSLQAFLGPHGLIRNGFSGQIFIPTPGESNSLSLTLEILDNSALPRSAIGKDTQRWPAGLMHLAWFWDLAPSHDLEVGVSALVQANHEPVSYPAQVYGADLSYKWRPYVLGDKHSFLFGGEFYTTNGIHTLNKGAWPIGTFLWSQFQINQWLYAGVRYDYTQGVDDNILSTHSAGAYLTYYTTEFLRLRLGYELALDTGVPDTRSNVMLELNFVFGSHPVEPYWVNR